MHDDVQQLECADGLLPREKVLGDDSLQRRNRAADKQKHDTMHRAIHLPINPLSQTHISGTHQHSSHDDRDQRQIDGDRTNRTVDEKLKDAGKYGHGTSEHLRDIRRRQ